MFTARTKIGSLLHNEHLVTLNALQRFEDFLNSQTTKTAPDITNGTVREILELVIASVAVDVERHFGFEETHLFPVLAQQGEGGMAAFLTEEHAVILPLALDLATQAKEALAGKGFTGEGWLEFRAAGLELCEREMFHIQKEEMGLLAAISMLVDEAADAELAAIYAKVTAAA